MVCVHDFWIWAFFLWWKWMESSIIFIKFLRIFLVFIGILEKWVGWGLIQKKRENWVCLVLRERERARRRERKIITKWESPLKYVLSSLSWLGHVACCSSLDGRSRESCTGVPMVRLNLSSFRLYQRTRLA